MEAARNAARRVLSKTNYRALSQKDSDMLAAIVVSLVLWDVRDIPEAQIAMLSGPEVT
jgi:hypothetical protein